MERKREKKNKSERRPVVVGCGWRVPPIKLNFHLPQRHTEIPASQSANLRQMILLSFPATLGVGTAQILIKKRACKLFLSHFKDLDNKVCVYVQRFCVVVFEPVGLGWFLLCMCECKHYLGSTAVRSRATAWETKYKRTASFILIDK